MPHRISAATGPGPWSATSSRSTSRLPGGSGSRTTPSRRMGHHSRSSAATCTTSASSPRLIGAYFSFKSLFFDVRCSLSCLRTSTPSFHHLRPSQDVGLHSSKVGCTGAIGRRIPKKPHPAMHFSSLELVMRIFSCICRIPDSYDV